MIDGQQVVLLDLSVTGAQVNCPAEIRLSQSVVFKIGFAEQPWFTALGRIQWVEREPATAAAGPSYRAGVAFEVWDVPAFKGIVERCRWASAH